MTRERLFTFHSDPGNLALLLEGWHGFELLHHEKSIAPGARVRLRQAVGPLRYEMVFEHFVCDPPVRFGERQVEGPFARFEHVHEFSEAPDGTRIIDHVEFALPWSVGGKLADRWIAAPLLRRFFEFRRAAYRRLVADGRLA